jgi:hypothetical protein
LCAIKFHLFWLLPLGLLMHRRWKTLAGGAAGGAVLVGASYAVAGTSWPGEFLALITSPRVHPNLGAMGSLRGMLWAFGVESGWWVWLACLLTAALSVYLLWRAREPQTVLAYALVAGLLTGGHAYIHDFALLVAAYAILAAGLPKPARIAFQFVLLPFLYCGLIAGAPYNALVPAALLGLMTSWAVGSRQVKCLI